MQLINDAAVKQGVITAHQDKQQVQEQQQVQEGLHELRN